MTDPPFSSYKQICQTVSLYGGSIIHQNEIYTCVLFFLYQSFLLCWLQCWVQLSQSQSSVPSSPWLLLHFGSPFNLVKLILFLSPSIANITLLYSFIVPIVGMLCGQSVAGIAIAVNYILKEFQYVHIGFSLFSFMFKQWNYPARIEIKLKFISRSEQVEQRLADLLLSKL